MNKPNKKIALAGVIVLVIILLVPLSYAAYTSVTSARRVVSTARANELLFSSNYLQTMSKSEMETSESSNKYKNIPVSYQSGNETQAVYISVCNYAQGYLTKWSDKDIDYHIEFSLVDLESHNSIENTKTYTDKSGNIVNGADILLKPFSVEEGIATSGNNNISTIYSGKSLKSETSNGTQNMYTVFLDTTYADIVGVKIEVITEETSPAYSGYGLGGVLCLSGYATEASAGWAGEVQEAPTNESGNTKESKDYTGFNYEVSGTGAGTVTVTWDATKFAISNIFLGDMKITPPTVDETEKKSISFNVGGADQDDRFFIQFYRVSPPDENETWSEINNAFSCDFAKTE